MDIQDRILLIISELGLNRNSFCNAIDVQAQTLHHIVSGRRTKPSFDVIEKIISTFSDINPTWLITGNGEMMLEKNAHPNAHLSKKIDNDTSKSIDVKNENKGIEYLLVPLYNFDAVGGSLNDVTDSTQYIEGYVPFLDAKTDDICMYVSGRSMLPTFPAGTIVLLHPIALWREFLEYGEIYVIDLKDDRRLIKEIRRSEKNHDDNFLLYSHNPDYDQIEISKHLINKVWIVKAIYQKTIM